MNFKILNCLLTLFCSVGAYYGAKAKTWIRPNLNLDFSRDLMDLIASATLQANCEGNVYISNEGCDYYLNNILKRAGPWTPPNILISDHFLARISTTSRSQKWDYFLSRNLKPCSLFFICQILPMASMMTNTSYNNSTEDIKTGPDGHIELTNLPRFITALDKVIYFSNGPTNLVDGTLQNLLERSGHLLHLKLSPGFENHTEYSVGEASFEVYHMCSHYDGPNFLGIWQRNVSKFSEFLVMLDEAKKSKSFSGYPLTVGYSEYPPHFSCKKGNQNSDFGPNECYGVEWEMLDLISRGLDFRINLTNLSVNENPTNYQIEDKTAGKSAVLKLIEAVDDNKLDFAVGGISVTPEREEMVDFSHIFAHEPIVFVVEKTTEIYILGIWLAFKPSLWLALAGMMVFMGILLKKFLRVDFSRGLLISLRSILGQPAGSLGSGWPMRVKLLVGGWWFASLVLTNLYNSNLISSLINPIPAQSDPETVQDLLRFGYYFRIASERQEGAIRELLENEEVGRTIPQIGMIRSRLLNTVGSNKGGNFRGRLVAYVLEESAVALVNWTRLFGGIGPSVKVIKERLSLTGYGWPMQTGTPYKRVMDNSISRLVAAGLPQHWREGAEISPGRKLRLREKLAEIRLDVGLLGGAFLLLGAGLSLGILGLVVELVVARYGATFRIFWKKLLEMVERSRRRPPGVGEMVLLVRPVGSLPNQPTNTRLYGGPTAGHVGFPYLR